MTFLRIGNLALTIYPILNFLVALIIAIPAYILFGNLGLEKKLPFSKLQIETGFLFLVFILVSVGLYIEQANSIGEKCAKEIAWFDYDF